MLVRPPNDGCQHDNADLANVLLEARPLLAVDSPARTGCRLDSWLLMNPQGSTLSCRRVVWRGYEQPWGSLRAGRLNFISNIMWSCWQFRLRLCSFMAVRQDWPISLYSDLPVDWNQSCPYSLTTLVFLLTGRPGRIFFGTTLRLPTSWNVKFISIFYDPADRQRNFVQFSLHLFSLLDGRQLVCILISLSTGNKKLSLQFNNSGILADWKTR